MANYSPKFKTGDLIKPKDGHKSSYGWSLKDIKELQVINEDVYGCGIKKKMIEVFLTKGRSENRTTFSGNAYENSRIYVYETQFELCTPVVEDYDVF